MRSPALFAAISIAAALPVAAQNLSWEDAIRREDALKQALEEAKALQAQLDLAGNPTAAPMPGANAYATLGQALLAHPDMALHNQALVSAKQALQTATASGDATITTSARKHLAAVQTARYNKAASIPELKKLIDAWKSEANKAADAKPENKAGTTKPPAKLTLQDLQV